MNKTNNFCLHSMSPLAKSTSVRGIGRRCEKRSTIDGQHSIFDFDRPVLCQERFPSSGFLTRAVFSFDPRLRIRGPYEIRNLAGPASVGAGVNGARGQKTPHQARRKTNSLIKRRLRFSFSLFSFMGYRAALFFLGGFFCFSVLCFSFSQVPMQAITTR
jgi:hypothetical protein